MPIYTDHPCDDGFFPMERHPLRSSIGIGPKVTKIIDAATKDWLDKHPEATTTVEVESLEERHLKSLFSLELCRCFDTAIDMQAATDLKAGMICHTNGFRSAGDNGAAFYKVTADGEPNGMDVLAMQNDLIANLVITELYVTPEQFGAYGDGVSADTTQIQRMLDISINHDIKLNAKTYLIDADIYTNYMCNIHGAGTNTIIKSNENHYIYIGNINTTTTARGANNRGCDIGYIRLENVGFILGEKTTDFIFGTHIHDCYWYNSEIWPITLKHRCAFLTFDNLFAENTNGLFEIFGEIDGTSVDESGSTLSFRDCFVANSTIASMLLHGVSRDGYSFMIDNCSFEHAPYSIYIDGYAHARADIYCNHLHSESNTIQCIYSDITDGANIHFYMNDNWIAPDNNNPIFYGSDHTYYHVNGGFIYQPNANPIFDGACICVFEAITPNTNLMMRDDIQASTFSGLTTVKGFQTPQLTPYAGPNRVVQLMATKKLYNYIKINYQFNFIPDASRLFAITLRVGTTNICSVTMTSTMRRANIEFEYDGVSAFGKITALDAASNVVVENQRVVTPTAGDKNIEIVFGPEFSAEDTITPVYYVIEGR